MRGCGLLREGGFPPHLDTRAWRPVEDQRGALFRVADPLFRLSEKLRPRITGAFGLNGGFQLVISLIDRPVGVSELAEDGIHLSLDARDLTKSDRMDFVGGQPGIGVRRELLRVVRGPLRQPPHPGVIVRLRKPFDQ